MGVPPGSRRVRTRWPIDRKRSARNEICVVFPLPSVPSKVMNGTFISNAFRPRPFRRILDDPALGLQFVAKSISAFEILRFARRLTGLNERSDFRRHFHFLGCADAEHGIHCV